VVSFSSASFPLTEESVGLALQCCHGGDRLGFRVYQLSDRRFRFSVASNKVGHFIYGLQDCIWLDFICHFSLFRGVHPSISSFHNGSIDTWSSSEQDVVIAQRSPTKIQPKLSVLLESARNDTSGSSDLELSKFGFVKSASLNHSQTPTEPKSLIKFGSFSDPVNLEDSNMLQKRFVGINFQQKLCEFLPVETLRKLQDLW
jgi:hypothetical protein